MHTETEHTQTDRIQKKIVLRSSRSRVWRAIADAKEFGSWFGMKVDGSFSPGATVKATIVPTTVDRDVADTQKQLKDMPFELMIDRVEPERLFSFRWHPYAIEANVDYASEPTTLVSFELEDVADGIQLTVTESGFDRIPLARRAKAFAANEHGWSIQTKLIEKYLAQAS
jgi:uncharacterized protein YndB with AHSA1/START domain